MKPGSLFYNVAVGAAFMGLGMWFVGKDNPEHRLTFFLAGAGLGAIGGVVLHFMDRTKGRK
jgi:hypothetical protein